jgi:hypothetical protein
MLKLVYILAASHSGSTLISMLLNSHPRVVTTGELKFSSKAIGDTDRYRCSCGQFINQCAFWQEIKKGMKSRGYEFDISSAGTDFSDVDSWYARKLLKPLHRGLLLELCRDCALNISPFWRRHLSQVQKRNAAVIETILKTTGAEVVVDSSKTDLRLKYLLRNKQLDIKIVRLIRDGRAVALTYMNPAEFADAVIADLRDGGTGGNRDKERLSMAQAAHQWKRSNEAAENILHRLDKSRWTEIRYEQLCSDTENTLAGLFDFLGLNHQERNRDFRSVENHVIGNGMRLDNSSQVELDERWKSVLTKEQLQDFDLIAGEMNVRYGYK